MSNWPELKEDVDQTLCPEVRQAPPTPQEARPPRGPAGGPGQKALLLLHRAGVRGWGQGSGWPRPTELRGDTRHPVAQTGEQVTEMPGVRSRL